MLRRIGFGLIVIAALIVAGAASARHRHQINPVPFSHSPCSVLDGRPCTRIVLGDWYDQGSVLRWDEHGPELSSLTR